MLSVLLGFILMAQVLPSIYIDSFGESVQWFVWNGSNLLIIILQALYIYVNIKFNNKIKKLTSLVILLLAVFFLYDFVCSLGFDGIWL